MSLLSATVSLLAPPACAVCRRPGPVPLCADCHADFRGTGPRACARCALPSHRGRPCPGAGAAWDAAWSAVVYAGAGADAVRALKYRARLPVAAAMAAEIAMRAPPWALPSDAAVVAVPPAPARRRRRGFDPAALLARELAAAVGLRHAAVLCRRGRVPRQAGASRRDRRTPGRIAVEAQGPIPPACVLVDDVHTTGATLDACARALRAGGARHVVAVTFGRTL